MATRGLKVDPRSDSTSGSAPQAQRAGLTARRAGARTTGVLGAWPAWRGPGTRDDFGELGPRGLGGAEAQGSLRCWVPGDLGVSGPRDTRTEPGPGRAGTLRCRDACRPEGLVFRALRRCTGLSTCGCAAPADVRRLRTDSTRTRRSGGQRSWRCSGERRPGALSARPASAGLRKWGGAPAAQAALRAWGRRASATAEQNRSRRPAPSGRPHWPPRRYRRREPSAARSRRSARKPPQAVDSQPALLWAWPPDFPPSVSLPFLPRAVCAAADPAPGRSSAPLCAPARTGYDIDLQILAGWQKRAAAT